MLRIQCNVNGYSNEAITLLATLNDENVLAFVKTHKYSEERIKEDFAMIGNSGEDLDFSFKDKDFNAAILAYFDRKANNRLAIAKELQRFEPDSGLQLDKVNESGRSYALSQNINNGQIAIIFACLFAQKQSGFAGANEFMEEMEDLYKSITI